MTFQVSLNTIQVREKNLPETNENLTTNRNKKTE